MVHDITAVILAGGENSRMNGENKALLTILGKSVFQRQMEVLWPIFPEIMVVTNSPDLYPNVITTHDVFMHAGPLAGIHAALKKTEKEFVFVFSCDMPFLSSVLIEKMIVAMDVNSCDVMVPRHEGKIEPLFAIYHKNVLNTVEWMLKVKKNQIRLLYDYCKSCFFDVPLNVESEKVFFNLNKPEDRIKAESYAK